jgi:glycerophosphoryl diester phosphodiesterase
MTNNIFPQYIAHRGAGSLAPENTMAALRMAHSYGINAVEFDVMLAKNHVPMLNHDNQLGRNILGTGEFIEYDSHALDHMDAGSYHSNQFIAEPVARFQTAFEFCIKHQLWMNIELKPYPGQDIITGHIVAQTIKNHQQRYPHHHAHYLISSFSIDALLATKKELPTAPLAMLWEQLPTNWQTTLKSINCTTIHLNYQTLTTPQINALLKHHITIRCYTVNDQTQATNLFIEGIHGIFTDNPVLLHKNTK